MALGGTILDGAADFNCQYKEDTSHWSARSSAHHHDLLSVHDRADHAISCKLVPLLGCVELKIDLPAQNLLHLLHGFSHFEDVDVTHEVHVTAGRLDSLHDRFEDECQLDAVAERPENAFDDVP